MPEMIVRKYLHSKGFRFRLHDKKLPGKPDIVLAKYKTVIFVHGCFWHAHEGCKYFRAPESNTDYWSAKIKRNIVRDELGRKALEDKGWRVLVVWECELKKNAELRCASLSDQLINASE